MKKLIIITTLMFFSLTLLGQKGKNKKLQEEALDDIEVLSSKNYPYIELFHQAVREKMSGNFTEAKKLFNDCLKEKQDDDAVYFALAEIAKTENNITAALEYFKRAYTIDPNNNVYLQELAFMHAEKANFEEAETLFKEMCEREPRNVDFIYGYSKVLIYNKKYKLAIEQLDKLQDQAGMVPELMMMKADLYSELKNPQKAEETLLELKKEFPDDLDVLKNVIGYYEQQGENEKAIRLIEELVESDPENGIAYFVLANNYLERKEIDKFLEVAPKIYQLKGVELQQKLFIFDQLKTHKKADDPILLNAIKQMYSEHPEDEYVLLNYGNALVIQKKTKEALTVFRKVIKNNPNNFEAWISVLSFESKYLEYKALYEDGNEAVTLFPTMPYVYFAASEGALRLNKAEEAMQLIAAGELYILGDNKQAAQFNMRKGQIYFHTKDYKKGIVAFEKALSTDDNSIIQINYALALVNANIALDIAEELLNKIDNKDKNSSFYLAKAILESNKKRIKEGISILEEGIEKTFNNAELYDLLGDFQLKNQATDKALEAWRNALINESRNKVLPKKIKEVKYYAPHYN
ncbi:MAG TPA: tetratricopeptide repeat protein [Brumimicrobium sp.]|nr:tetratricopeptide repeat protein [Brumimicrobium sp.]